MRHENTPIKQEKQMNQSKHIKHNKGNIRVIIQRVISNSRKRPINLQQQMQKYKLYRERWKIQRPKTVYRKCETEITQGKVQVIPKFSTNEGD